MTLDTLQQAIENHLKDEPGIYSVELVLPDSGEVISYNHRSLPSASLIKVFIMAEAFRRRDAGELDLSQTAAVTPEVQVGGAGPLEHAAIGSRLSLLELIELMITESDNTATNILIDLLGMASVNRLVKRFGCPDTLLARRMMDFTARAAGIDNFTSPADMNCLLGRILARQCISPDSDAAMLAILLRQTDKCKLPLYLPSDIGVANKTGELDGVEHDAGIILSQPPYILTIMTDGLPDEERGRQTIASLSRVVYDFLQTNKS